MAQTALTIVNRVLRRHRQEDVSALTEPLPKVVLDAVNESAREIVAERNWPWNVRSDGVLVTKPPITGTDASIFNGASAFATLAYAGDIEDVTGEFVARVSFPEDATYGDTSFRVVSAVKTTGLVATIDAQWPGTTVVTTTADYSIFIAEYLLPDTVSKVVSMRHEQTPLRVQEVAPWTSFDELVPRPQDTTDDMPSFVAIGGSAVGTYNSTAGDPKLRAMLWPVPSEALVIHYSYHYRPPAMTVVTDSLPFPDEIVDVVVDLAFAKTQMNMIGNNEKMGLTNMRIAQQMAAAKYANNVSDPSRRRSLGAHDSIRNSRGRDATNYRDVTGL